MLADEDHQLAAGQFASLAVNIELKAVAIGDRIVQDCQCIGAGDILDIDNLLFWLAERMGLELAQCFEIVAVIAAGRHQALRIGFIQLFPPDFEEQTTVLQAGEELVDARQKCLGRLVLGIPREIQGCKRTDAAAGARQRLRFAAK